MSRPPYDVAEGDKFTRFDVNLFRHGDDKFYAGFRMCAGWWDAAKVGHFLASCCDRAFAAEQLIADLTEIGWLSVLSPLIEKHASLKELEAARAASHAVVAEAKINVLIAFYQGWVARRGGEFLSQEDRFYWCCRDYLSFIHGDLHRMDEDFPLRHRHYNAQNMSSVLKQALLGDVKRLPSAGATPA